MTTDRIIALFSSIAALPTAGAALWNIVEMKRQRADTYRPELIITEKTFISKCGYITPVWQKYHEGEIIKENSTHPGISLCNIGLGAAKNIKASWSFPTEELIKLIKNEAKKNRRDVSFIDDIITGAMIIEPEGEKPFAAMKTKFFSQSIDYIIPSSNQSDHIILKLPVIYTCLTSLLPRIAVGYEAMKEGLIPDLKLKLEYYDIANSKHSSSFTLQLEYVQMDINGKEFTASLKPKIDVL